MDSVQITARISPGLVNQIDRYAAGHRWSRATAVKALLARGLEAEGESAMARRAEEIIRAKSVMDGAATLQEAADRLREFASELDRLRTEGWELRQPVEDDYGFVVPVAKKG